VGKKRQDEGPEALAPGAGGDPGEDPPVAEVETVEVPDGDHGSPPETGEPLEAGEDLHGFMS
jgi:hypothetical protein